MGASLAGLQLLVLQEGGASPNKAAVQSDLTCLCRLAGQCSPPQNRWPPLAPRQQQTGQHTAPAPGVALRLQTGVTSALASLVHMEPVRDEHSSDTAYKAHLILDSARPRQTGPGAAALLELSGGDVYKS